MCEMHNIWCETLRQTKSFPQPDSVYRTPTGTEYEKYGHGKPIPAPRIKNKRAIKHTPNLVVYSDISEDGGVPSTLPVGVDEPYNDPVLARVRIRAYPAAAGSATQSTIDEVVVRGVGAGSSTPGNLTLNASTQTGCSQGLSDVMLDRIESYLRHSPKPWQTRKLLPGLFRLLPGHDPATLTVALMSIIRGARLSAETILEESAAQPSLV